MIRFACSCGHRFEVDDDQAGGWVQCPECRLLNDIPSLAELANFTEDGIYKLDAGKPAADSNIDRLADIGIIYSKSKLDADGNEIDLRTIPAGNAPEKKASDALYSGEVIEDDDTGELDFKSTGPSERDELLHPKYDPETGELIRPLDIVPSADHVANPADIPMAKATISYAGGGMDKKITPLNIATELFLPMNLVVMSFVIAAQVFSAVMFVVMIAALFFLVPPWIILQCIILAHYGNVIDSTGRREEDDLPRPMRDMEWIEDIWHPFCQMFGGLMICFAVPTLALLAVGHFIHAPPVIAFIIGGMVGTFLGPAVLLTTNTSGSTANLRPDRVLGVMRACGGHYLSIMLLWAATWPIYLLGWVGFCGAMARSFGHEVVLVFILKHLTGVELDDIGIFGNWLIVGPALFVGAYLMHYFAWYLGLLYRGFYNGFPWVLQRHIADPTLRGGAHAAKLGKRRPRPGHLPPMDAQLPQSPPPPPPAASRLG